MGPSVGWGVGAASPVEAGEGAFCPTFGSTGFSAGGVPSWLPHLGQNFGFPSRGVPQFGQNFGPAATCSGLFS